MLSLKEAQQLMKDFISLKKKYEETKSIKDKRDYDTHYITCMEKFEYIVAMRTNKYKSFSNYEDLLQEGRFALVKAMTTYNPKKGNFFGWAHHYIGTRVYRHANLHTAVRYPLKFAKEHSPRKESIFPIQIEQVNCPDKELDIKEIHSEIKEAIGFLTNKQQEAVKLYFGIDAEQQSLTKISKKLGITRPICIQEIDNALGLLKNIIEY